LLLLWLLVIIEGGGFTGSVGMALVLPALTDCRWKLESLLVQLPTKKKCFVSPQLMLFIYIAGTCRKAGSPLPGLEGGASLSH